MCVEDRLSEVIVESPLEKCTAVVQIGATKCTCEGSKRIDIVTRH